MVGEADTLAGMPLFRRKDDASAAGGGSARTDARSESDWRAYDDVAEAYARVLAPRTGEVANDLVGLLEPAPSWKVLDVGTGTGSFARAAGAKEGVRAVGVDASPAMVLEAARDGSGPVYAAAEAIDLPFRPSTFDGVTAGFVLSHFAKYDTALFDMLRVLRPGGRLAVATWGPATDEFSLAWRDVATEFAEIEMLRDAQAKAIPWDERFADPNRLKDTLYEAGLRGIRVEHAEYRFDMRAEDYLQSREISAAGRFLHAMLGEEFFETFRSRARQVFADRFPQTFHDFRDVNLAVGTKP